MAHHARFALLLLLAATSSLLHTHVAALPLAGDDDNSGQAAMLPETNDPVGLVAEVSGALMSDDVMSDDVMSDDLMSDDATSDYDAEDDYDGSVEKRGDGIDAPIDASKEARGDEVEEDYDDVTVEVTETPETPGDDSDVDGEDAASALLSAGDNVAETSNAAISAQEDVTNRENSGDVSKAVDVPDSDAHAPTNATPLSHVDNNRDAASDAALVRRISDDEDSDVTADSTSGDVDDVAFISNGKDAAAAAVQPIGGRMLVAADGDRDDGAKPSDLSSDDYDEDDYRGGDDDDGGGVVEDAITAIEGGVERVLGIGPLEKADADDREGSEDRGGEEILISGGPGPSNVQIGVFCLSIGLLVASAVMVFFICRINNASAVENAQLVAPLSKIPYTRVETGEVDAGK